MKVEDILPLILLGTLVIIAILGLACGIYTGLATEGLIGNLQGVNTTIPGVQ